MNKILCKFDEHDVRQWHNVLVSRLRAAGFSLDCTFVDGAFKPSMVDRLLRLEAHRFGDGLATQRPLPATAVGDDHDLVIDFTSGDHSTVAQPTLRLRWNGQCDFRDGLGQMLATGTLPELTLWRDGNAVAEARPMMSDRLWLSRICDEMLAGAIGLVEAGVKRHFAGLLVPLDTMTAPPTRAGFLRHYLPHVVKATSTRAMGKLRRGRPFYWQVGYRLGATPIDWMAPELGEHPFETLPDDGARFYADPFVVQNGEKTFLFVEEYPYALGRGVISVSEMGADGRFDTPREVLREPHHLSYPQVFTHEGEIFMLPESGGAGRLVLYRATQFPDRWEPDTVLIEGVDINDATLVEQHGRLYLFATERLAPGNASDRMVVYTATNLRGPWSPHRLNPITIDRAGARPGGPVLRQGNRLWLKVQDGSSAYGGGLGLCEVLRLDTEMVRLGPVYPIAKGRAWARSGIHTLDRAGDVEVVDSAG